MPNLNFEGYNTLYATHGLHPYAAKCPPQLVKYALRYFSRRGERVLDPMVGSGTTLVEAKLLGREGIGIDIDPVARLIARVKCKALDDIAIGKAMANLDLRMRNNGQPEESGGETIQLPDFPKREYWFTDEVTKSLTQLASYIRDVEMSAEVREFFWVGFTSLILARTSVANARDIVHSRHHFLQHSTIPDVFKKFQGRVITMRKQMLDFASRLPRNPQNAVVISGDARRLDQEDESIDLVFTSPPYVTALDYTRSHFLAVGWLESELGLNVDEYRKRAVDYVGTERQPSLKRDDSIDVEEIRSLRSVLNVLRTNAPAQALLTERYFVDMYKVMTEMYRVLRPRKHAVIVVCPSHIRKVDVPSHKILMEMGKVAGFEAKRCYSRVIDVRKRLLPFAKNSVGNRMSTEYVLLFQRS